MTDTSPNPNRDADTAGASEPAATASGDVQGEPDPAPGRGVWETADAILPTWLVRYRVPIGLVLFVLLLRPVVALPFMLGFESVASTILIVVLFVAAFNLLFGYTGLLSFGHAMFFGFGMYGAAIAMSGKGIAPTLPFAVGAGVGIAVAAVVGYALGRLTVGKGEIYFAFLTLAVAEAVAFIANRDPFGLTGGSNGISGGAQPAWIESFRGELTVTLIPWPSGVIDAVGWLDDWYLLVGLVFVLAMGALWQIVRSPFGRSLIAIRENEQLARAMGVDTTRYKVWSVTFSGVFSAIAGVLLVIQSSGAAIENLSPFTSGDTVLMAVLGGVNYFFGPVVGAVVWLFTEDYLTSFEVLHFPLAEATLVSIELGDLLVYWQFLLGALFVVVVMTAPEEGIWGYVRSTGGWIADRVREVIR
jgi:branched-chain amino acid transport system permease protein